MKWCRRCCKIKNEFNKDTRAKDGLTTYCADCRRELSLRYRTKNADTERERTRAYAKSHREARQMYYQRVREAQSLHTMLRAAKARARKKGIYFELTESDIQMPELCPILKIRLERFGKTRRESPSLDRIVPELGYVPGNVQVISLKANVMKNDASVEDLRQFASWVRENYGMVA